MAVSRVVEKRLGPKDLLLTPPGRSHYFRNEWLADVQFMMAVGTANREDAEFKAAA